MMKSSTTPDPDPKSTPSTRRSRRSRSGLSWWVMALFAVPVLAVVLLVCAWVGVTSFLRGEAFRSLMTKETNKALKAEGKYGKFDWNGTTVYTPEYNAVGSEDGYFTTLESTSIRAEMDLDGVKRGYWTIKRLEIGTLDLKLSNQSADGLASTPGTPALYPTTGDREDDSVEILPNAPIYGSDTSTAASQTVAPPSSSAPPSESVDPVSTRSTGALTPEKRGLLSGWLPDDLELQVISVKKGSVAWEPQPGQDGRLAGTRMELTPLDSTDLANGWVVQGGDGTFQQAGLPSFELGEYRVRVNTDEVLVEHANLRGPLDSTLEAEGSVKLEPEVDANIKAKLRGYPLSEVLRGDWQKRLEGRLSGDVHVTGSPTSPDGVAEGTLYVEGGVLQGLPILDQIAKYTRTERFMRLQLDQAQTEFRRKGERTEIKNLLIESKGLLKLTGGCIIKPNHLKGEFRVGVTSASLRWLPGAEKRVFTESAEGYLWTTMKVNGPVEAPREDLTPRLVQAAGDEIMEEATDFINKTKDQADEGTKKAIDTGLQILNSFLR